MDVLQRLTKNSIVIFLARGIETGAAFVIVALTTRYLNVDLFGEYAWILALVLFFQPLVNFELNTILIRETAKHPEKSSEILGNCLVIKWVLLAVFVIIIIILTAVLNLTWVSKVALIVALVSEIFMQHSMLFSGIFTAYERMEYELILTLLFRAISLIGVAVCVAFDLGFISLFVVMLLASFLRFSVGYHIIRSKFIAIRPVISKTVIKYLTAEAALVTIGSFLTSLSFRVDIYILKWLKGTTDVSLFHLPHMIVLQLQIIPAALVTALFPVLSRWGRGEETSLRKTWLFANKLLIIIGGVFVLGGTVFSRFIIEILGGESFLRSSDSLLILIWCSIILFLNLLSCHLLIALGLQRKLIVGAAISLIVNTVLDILLIPSMGHIGASIGTLVGYLSQIIIVIIFLTNALGKNQVLRSTLVPLIAVGLATGAAYLLCPISTLLAFFAGLCSLTALLALFHVFTHSELDFIFKFKRLITRRPPGPVS